MVCSADQFCAAQECAQPRQEPFWIVNFWRKPQPWCPLMLTEEQVQLSITGCMHEPVWLMPSIWYIDVVWWFAKKKRWFGVWSLYGGVAWYSFGWKEIFSWAGGVIRWFLLGSCYGFVLVLSVHRWWRLSCVWFVSDDATWFSTIQTLIYDVELFAYRQDLPAVIYLFSCHPGVNLRV